MKRLILAVVAVALFVALAPRAEAHGPQQFRGRQQFRNPSRLGLGPGVGYGLSARQLLIQAHLAELRGQFRLAAQLRAQARQQLILGF